MRREVLSSPVSMNGLQQQNVWRHNQLKITCQFTFFQSSGVDGRLKPYVQYMHTEQHIIGRTGKKRVVLFFSWVKSWKFCHCSHSYLTKKKHILPSCSREHVSVTGVLSFFFLPWCGIGMYVMKSSSLQLSCRWMHLNLACHFITELYIHQGRRFGPFPQQTLCLFGDFARGGGISLAGVRSGAFSAPKQKAARTR